MLRQLEVDAAGGAEVPTGAAQPVLLQEDEANP
jgi:hypothetical protein